MKFIVYCITNKLNGKRYIGWSSKEIKERWKRHVYNANSLNSSSTIFVNAIRKYGSSDDIWSFDILSEHLSSMHAKQAEIDAICEFGTNALEGGNGYNMTFGGDGCVMTGENNPFYGRHHTRKSISKMRKTLGDKLSGANNPQFGLRGEMSPCWGRQHSEETKRKISEKLSGRIVSASTKRKMSLAAKNRKPTTDAARKNMSDAQKKHWAKVKGNENIDESKT